MDPPSPASRLVTSWVLTRVEGQLWVGTGRQEAQSRQQPRARLSREHECSSGAPVPGAAGSVGSRVSQGVSGKRPAEKPGLQGPWSGTGCVTTGRHGQFSVSPPVPRRPYESGALGRFAVSVMRRLRLRGSGNGRQRTTSFSPQGPESS